MDFVTVRTEVQAAGFDDWTSKIEQRGGTRSPNRCERSRAAGFDDWPLSLFAHSDSRTRPLAECSFHGDPTLWWQWRAGFGRRPRRKPMI